LFSTVFMRVPPSILSESARIIGWTAGNGPAAYYINTVRVQLDQIVHLPHYILLHWPIIVILPTPLRAISTIIFSTAAAGTLSLKDTFMFCIDTSKPSFTRSCIALSYSARALGRRLHIGKREVEIRQGSRLHAQRRRAVSHTRLRLEVLHRDPMNACYCRALAVETIVVALNDIPKPL
jgi:hypothetical protein